MLYMSFHLPEQSIKAERYMLSALDEGVFLRLSRVYAYFEAPLPLEESDLLRLIGSKTKKYRESLSRVLSIFFRKTEGGYVSDDIDQAINEASSRQNQAKKAAEVRYSKSCKEDVVTQKNSEQCMSTAQGLLNNLSEQCMSTANSNQLTDNSNNINNPCISTSVDTTSPSFSLDASEDGTSEKMPSTEKQPRKKKHRLPDDFRITPEIRNWYEARLLSECTWKPEDLPNFFEAYVNYCKANDKTYIDHYAALRQAIIGDWGKVREQRIQEERNEKRDFQYLSTAEKFSRCSKSKEKILRGEIYEHESAVDRASDGAFVFTTRSNLSPEVDVSLLG